MTVDSGMTAGQLIDIPVIFSPPRQFQAEHAAGQQFL